MQLLATPPAERENPLHHLPPEIGLGREMVQRYTGDFMDRLGPADDGPPAACLTRYVTLFRVSLGQGRMCLCGMMGAEITGVPEAVLGDVQGFFAANRDWLTQVMNRTKTPRPALEAGIFLATLEGALMIARVCGDAAGFDAVAQACIDRITGR